MINYIPQKAMYAIDCSYLSSGIIQSVEHAAVYFMSKMLNTHESTSRGAAQIDGICASDLFHHLQRTWCLETNTVCKCYAMLYQYQFSHYFSKEIDGFESLPQKHIISSILYVNE